MTISDDVSRFYYDSGIAALDFVCPHRPICSGASVNFVGITEAYVEINYDAGRAGVPRLLFISLDPGAAQADPQTRTADAQRADEDSLEQFNRLRGGRHWRQTHDLAAYMLRPFIRDLTAHASQRWFAHTRSAKCCENWPNDRAARDVLHRGYSGYLSGEVTALLPDIIFYAGSMGSG